MTWKKTWFSYLLWISYTIGTVLFAIFAIRLAGLELGMQDWPIWVQWGTYCVPFVLGGLIYVLLSLFRKLPRKAVYGSKWLIAEGVLVVLLVATGILLRTLLFPGEVGAGDNAFFLQSRVEQGKSVEPYAHGALYYYLLLLRAVFMFVGNHFSAGIILQIVLQILSAVFIYAGVRKLSGALPAVVMMAGLMLLPTYVSASLRYSPDALYLFLYGIGLWGVACYMDMVGKGRFHRWYQCVWLALLGVYISFLTYMDILGVSLLAIAAAVLWLEQKTEDGEDIRNDRVVTLFVVTVGFLAGILCFLCINALISHLPILTVVEAWERLFSFEQYQWSYSITSSLDSFLPLILAVFLVMGIFSFFAVKKQERGGIWTLGFLTAVGLCYNCLASYNMERFVTAGVLLLILLSTVLQETVRGKDPVEALSIPPILQEINLEENESEDKKDTIQFIPNPLPLPKKHVKRTMDYKVEPSDEMLCFDKEVDENDDFDN